MFRWLDSMFSKARRSGRTYGSARRLRLRARSRAPRLRHDPTSPLQRTTMLLSPRMQRKGGRPRTRSRTAPSVDGGVTRLSALTRRSKTRPSERNSAAAVETAHTDGVDTTQTVPVKLQQRSSVARGMVALGLQRSPVPPAFRLPLQLLRAVSTAAALDDEPEASPRHDESLRPSSSETRSPRRSSGSSPVKPLFRYDSKTKQYLRVLTPRDPLGVARQESIFDVLGL